jgi:hypothetical protein
MLETTGVVGEPRLVDQLRPADQAHNPLSDRLRATGQPKPAAIS